MLVGDGEEKNHILNMIQKLGIDESVFIISNRIDVPDILKAMDVMIFPSISEGVPVTLVESQIAGLKCIASDSITREVAISNLLEYRSISENPKMWAKRALDWHIDKVQYHNIEKWDMREVVNHLERLYINATGR